MMNVKKGMKIKAIRDNGSIILKGAVCTVTDIDELGNIFYVTENPYLDDREVHGCISELMFDKYFEIIEEKQCEGSKTPFEFQTKVTGKDVDDLMERSKFIIDTVFDKCTIVSCKLPNGFVIVETSSCVDPDNYDEDLGVEVCMKRIKDKVWELEGYLLQNDIHMRDMIMNDTHDNEDVDGSDEPCCDGDCFNCPEFDSVENSNGSDDDYDYWDRIADAHKDFLDWVDDYFDDMAERDKRYRNQ